jgi:hypothetical protein
MKNGEGHFPIVSWLGVPFTHTRFGQKFGHALLTSQSFSRWHTDGVACRQQAGKKRAKSEQRSGYEEAPRAKFALHPVREDGAEKAVNRNTHDDPRRYTNQRDPRGNPQHMSARRA